MAANSRARQTTRTAREAIGGTEPGRGTLDMGTIGLSIGYRIRRAQVAVFQDLIKAFAAHDIRPAQYSVLVLIAANPGLNQSEIASALGIKRANFVALIDALETRGLALRMATANDRRSYALHLTDRGNELLSELNRLQSAHEARIVAAIGADKRADLLTMLDQITSLAATADEADDDGLA